MLTARPGTTGFSLIAGKELKTQVGEKARRDKIGAPVNSEKSMDALWSTEHTSGSRFGRRKCERVLGT